MVHNKECLKVAYVVSREGINVLSFTRLATIGVPPNILFGAKCKILRDGIERKDLSVWNPRRNGINASELEIGDQVHVELASPEDFYPNLHAHNKKHPGLIVFIDPVLQTALESGTATA